MLDAVCECCGIAAHVELTLQSFAGGQAVSPRSPDHIDMHSFASCLEWY